MSSLCVPHRRSLTALLDAEWRRLRRRPESLLQATAWALTDGPVGSLDEVLHAIGYDVAPTGDHDARLARLVAIARDDDLAARVVVRRCLPIALSVATRRLRNGCPNAIEELFAALWIAIRTYDTSRRPSCLAAALVADADYRAFRATWRAPHRVEIPSDRIVELAAREPEPDARAELEELLDEAAAAGVATRDDLALLRDLATDPSPSRLARQWNIDERTIRNRRNRLTATLREMARELAAA